LIAVGRRLSKSIIIFIVLFVIANLVFAGFAINSATNKASQVAKEQLGATITVSYDRQKAMEDARTQMEQQQQQSGSTQSGQRFRINMQDMNATLPVDIADKISSLSGILGSNYITNGNANAVDFTPVNSSSSDSSSSSSASTGRQGGQFNFMASAVSIVGVKSTEIDDDFTSGISMLVTDSTGAESRNLTADDIGQKNVIIEKNLASENDLKIGDTISMSAVTFNFGNNGTSTDDNTTASYTFTIVGIFEDTTNSGSINQQTAFNSPYNKIYTDYQSADLLSAAIDSDGNEIAETGVNTAIYYVDDPADVDKVADEIKNLDGFDADAYLVQTNDDVYQEMVKPIDNVANMVKWTLLIVAVAGAVILALILILSIRERMYETGIMMSMGESRFKITLQYLCEVVIIAVIAFSLSIASGTFLAKGVGNQLVKQEITSVESPPTDNSNTATNGSGRQGGFQGGNPGAYSGNRTGRSAQNTLRSQYNINNVNYVDNIDVRANASDIAFTFLIGLAVIVVSIALPALSIMRFKPKAILSKLS
jgi:putative ABC transport system permease protein